MSNMPTNLGRTIDPRLPSNLIILVIAAAATVLVGIARLSNGMPIAEVALHAVGTGVFTVLAWAVGREIDPDNNLSAQVAAVLFALVMLYWDLPNLLAVGAVIACVRILTRSTGLPPKLLDSVILVGLAGLVTVVSDHWIIGLTIGGTFLLDALLTDPDRPKDLIFAALATGITIGIALLINPTPRNPYIETPLNAVVILTALIYSGIVLRAMPAVQSTADYTGEQLNNRRVLAGRLLVLIVTLALVMWDGMTGLVALAPVWMAMAGLVVRNMVPLLRN